MFKAAPCTVAMTGKQHGAVEGCALIFCENSRITTRCCTTVDMRMPTKKYTPCPRAKEKPQQDGRRGHIAFRIKPHTCQRCSAVSNKTLCTPGDSTETEPDLPLSVCTSLLGNLPFFKIHVNHFMARENSPCAGVILKCMLWVRAPVPISEF